MKEFSSIDTDLPSPNPADQPISAADVRPYQRPKGTPADGPGTGHSSGDSLIKQRTTGLLSILAFMLMLSFFLPYTVERMSYSLTRGRQRAEYETAGEHLKNLGLDDISKACQLVAQRVGPSVVHINVVSARVGVGKGLSRTSTRRHPPTDQGSGIIIDPAGYILTNRHVIGRARDIQVKLSDGRRVEAKVVGVDQATDLAVLRIRATQLIAAQWGDSDRLDVGALVWALGSPFGLEHSVTFGIVSAKHRSGILSAQNSSDGTAINYQDFLQTDAAVNPGNSGGPLVDSEGRVVGINTAIAGEWYQGISFAIPSSVARPIYERLRDDGRVQRGWLGVAPLDVPVDLAKKIGLEGRRGALVGYVEPRSPAARAGLHQGDVIIQWRGQQVTSRTDLFRKVALTPIGQPIEVVVVRAGKRKTLRVTVADRDLEGPVE